MSLPKKNLKRDSAGHPIAACKRENLEEAPSQHRYNSNDPKEAEGISNSKKLIDLNDDCISEIFKYLNVNDLINLFAVSDRFDDLIALYIEKIEFSLSKFRKMFSLIQAEFMLSRFGRYIKRLKCRQRSYYYSDIRIDRQYYELVCKYCRNIEEIDYAFKSENGLNTEIFKEFKDKLKVLKIGHDKLGDEQCSVIGQLSRLEVLDFKLPSKITGKYLTDLKNLRNLNISKCENFKPEFFNQLFLQNRIKTLSVNCMNLDDISFGILNKSDCLTYLELTEANFLINTSILSKLKALRSINICGQDGGEEVLKLLAQFHFDTLEILDIFYGSYYDMSNEELESILKFKNLKYFRCRSKPFNKEYLYELAGNLPNLESLHVFIDDEFTLDDFLMRFPNIKDRILEWEPGYFLR